MVFRDCLEVSGVLHTRAGHGPTAVTGVRVVPPGGGAVDEVTADLVVDATGRGSRTPVWLRELGYEPPAEERIAVRVKYASQTLRLPAGDQPMRFAIEGRSPERDLGVALFGCERDRWTFTVLGAERAFPTATREWMLAVTEKILPEWALKIVRAAEPLGPVSTHRHPASVRRRYDQLTRFPAGLLVIGDAMCVFNPVYGTGMSVAAEQASVLRTTIAGGSHDLAKRFLRASAAPTEAAWQLAAGSDLAYPEVEANPTLPMRLVRRYVDQVLRVAEHNPEVARRFMAVAGLVAPRTAVFSPRVLGPVVRSLAGRLRPAPVAVPKQLGELGVGVLGATPEFHEVGLLGRLTDRPGSGP